MAVTKKITCPECNSTNVYVTKEKHNCRHCGHSWDRKKGGTDERKG
jgi:transposase-like protein